MNELINIIKKHKFKKETDSYWFLTTNHVVIKVEVYLTMFYYSIYDIKTFKGIKRDYLPNIKVYRLENIIRKYKLQTILNETY